MNTKSLYLHALYGTDRTFVWCLAHATKDDILTTLKMFKDRPKRDYNYYRAEYGLKLGLK